MRALTLNFFVLGWIVDGLTLQSLNQKASKLERQVRSGVVVMVYLARQVCCGVVVAVAPEAGECRGVVVVV